MKLETDLARIKGLAKKRDDQNWEFRTFLKWHDGPIEIDSLVHDLYRKISSEIDCKQCANCCREIQPVLNEEDVRLFSEGLGLSVDKFTAQYLAPVKNSSELRFNKKPCPFLKENLCGNYEHRPEDCRSYPHLHKDRFVSRLMGMFWNCSVCPIVFNVLERLKREVRYNK